MREGRGQAKCVRLRTRGGGGGGESRECFKVEKKCAKKCFWTTKSHNFSFFVQKKLLHCHLLLCLEKCNQP